MGERATDRWPARLHVVTGKGGTGKTTVAAALALGLAAGGRRTLLVEVEGRQGIAQLFGAEPLPYEELRIADAPGRRRGAGAGRRPRGGPARIPRHVLQAGRGRPGAAQGRRDRLRHHDRPGPARRAAHRQGQGGHHPHRRTAAGRTTRWCWTRRRPAGSAGSSTSPPRPPGWPRWARSRPRARASPSLLRSPITSVHVVTLLEEMPVQETPGRDRRADRAATSRSAGSS